MPTYFFVDPHAESGWRFLKSYPYAHSEVERAEQFELIKAKYLKASPDVDTPPRLPTNRYEREDVI